MAKWLEGGVLMPMNIFFVETLLSAESGGLVDTEGSPSEGGCEFESRLKLFNFLQIT